MPRLFRPRATVLLAAVALLASACDGTPAALETPTPATTAREPGPEPHPTTPEPTVEATSEPTPEPTPEPTEPPNPPVTADDPGGLADQIVWAEQTIREGGPDDPEVVAAGRLQQVAYRQLAVQPEWRPEVLARVPEELRPAVEANADAAADLRAMITPRTPEQGLPAWRIVEPAPAEELLAHYRAAEEEFGVAWGYLASIHLIETRMGRIRGTSTAGAQGPMQFMPGTWEAYGEGDVNDNGDAIRAAARYLRASGAPGDMDQAIFRYNRDARYVRAVRRYAEQMLADERAFHGYYHWQVYYLTTDGDVLLPVGYGEEEAG
jgi:hypothetical protein